VCPTCLVMCKCVVSCTHANVNILQQTATDCSTLHYTATHCTMSLFCVSYTSSHIQMSLEPFPRVLHTCKYQHIATHCNTLQHTTAYCDTLQHTATQHRLLNIALNFFFSTRKRDLQSAERHSKALQHTAAHCKTLNTLQQNTDSEMLR